MALVLFVGKSRSLDIYFCLGWVTFEIRGWATPDHLVEDTGHIGRGGKSATCGGFLNRHTIGQQPAYVLDATLVQLRQKRFVKGFGKRVI